jgi:hypothetical protein
MIHETGLNCRLTISTPLNVVVWWVPVIKHDKPLFFYYCVVENFKIFYIIFYCFNVLIIITTTTISNKLTNIVVKDLSTVDSLPKINPGHPSCSFYSCSTNPKSKDEKIKKKLSQILENMLHIHLRGSLTSSSYVYIYKKN